MLCHHQPLSVWLFASIAQCFVSLIPCVLHPLPDTGTVKSHILVLIKYGFSL